MDTLESMGWMGSVDCVFSIDAMVHVDLQYLIVYLITASQALRDGGVISLSLADATNERGFQKMITDIDWCFPKQGQITGKFEWMSPDLVKSILEKVGFGDVQFVETDIRDIFVVAKKKFSFEYEWVKA